MVKVCDKYCDGCIYRGLIHGEFPWCKYLFTEDHMRPCPPGEGCTVKLTPEMIAARKKAEKIEKVMLTITCQICGTEFQTTDMKRKNCSKECLKESRRRAGKAYYARRKAVANG